MPVYRRPRCFSSYVFVCLLWAHASWGKDLPNAEEIQTWKTINIGTYRSVITLRDALEASDCAVADGINSADHKIGTAIPCLLGNSANEIMSRAEFNLSRAPTEIQLVLVSGKDLGFPPDSQPSLRELYARAEARGFALCPPEIGPQLRLQYTSQVIGEFLRIAMKPIRDYAGDLTAFSVGNGGAGLSLIGNSGNPDFRIPATKFFVFMRASHPNNHGIELVTGP